ncbi:MAG: ribosomal RNA small subunit methyltransferase A [Ruminococcaceae bacterium]|nr:ribosomal RNA small subunit methyltransferase A [Oscillospiraceae bacterium]
MNLCDFDTIQQLLLRHGFKFSKSMGQNFLIDGNVPVAIAEASEADETCGVLEIGPGIGALTTQLARRAGKVVSIELDRDLLPVLQETLVAHDNVEVISGDALRLDLRTLILEKFQGLTPMVCANLPYNITTPILTALLDIPELTAITVLIQKEAAQRICARPGTSEVSAFSMQMQYQMELEPVLEVPRECFYPVPKVTSTVLRCVRRSTPAVQVKDEVLFRKVLQGAYLLRRKTLVNSLASALPRFSKETIRQAILAAGLPETVRGEQLTLENIAALSDFLTVA